MINLFVCINQCESVCISCISIKDVWMSYSNEICQLKTSNENDFIIAIRRQWLQIYVETLFEFRTRAKPNILRWTLNFIKITWSSVVVIKLNAVLFFCFLKKKFNLRNTHAISNITGYITMVTVQDVGRMICSVKRLVYPWHFSKWAILLKWVSWF